MLTLITILLISLVSIFFQINKQLVQLNQKFESKFSEINTKSNQINSKFILFSSSVGSMKYKRAQCLIMLFRYRLCAQAYLGQDIRHCLLFIINFFVFVKS